jgi:hypothetical protein
MYFSTLREKAGHKGLEVRKLSEEMTRGKGSRHFWVLAFLRVHGNDSLSSTIVVHDSRDVFVLYSSIPWLGRKGLLWGSTLHG